MAIRAVALAFLVVIPEGDLLLSRSLPPGYTQTIIRPPSILILLLFASRPNCEAAHSLPYFGCCTYFSHF
jgi:hypothetical protein